MTCEGVLVRSSGGEGWGGGDSTLPQEKQRMGMIMFACWLWSELAPLMFLSKTSCWWWRLVKCRVVVAEGFRAVSEKFWDISYEAFD